MEESYHHHHHHHHHHGHEAGNQYEGQENRLDMCKQKNIFKI
jgi:hypothetical protein